MSQWIVRTLSKIQTENVILIWRSILVHGLEKSFTECNIDCFRTSSLVCAVHSYWTVLTEFGNILCIPTNAEDWRETRFVLNILKQLLGERVWWAWCSYEVGCVAEPGWSGKELNASGGLVPYSIDMDINCRSSGIASFAPAGTSNDTEIFEVLSTTWSERRESSEEVAETNNCKDAIAKATEVAKLSRDIVISSRAKMTEPQASRERSLKTLNNHGNPNHTWSGNGHTYRALLALHLRRPCRRQLPARSSQKFISWSPAKRRNGNLFSAASVDDRDSDAPVHKG